MDNKIHKLVKARVPDVDIELELNEVQPPIRIRPAEIAQIADEAQDALMATGFPIYERGGTLVHPVIRTVEAANGHITKIAVLKEIDKTYLRYVLSKTTNWVKYNANSKRDKPANPPVEVANMILSLNVEVWPFPTIKSIISTPTIRPDGSILDKPGYDKATGLLLVGLPPMPPMLEQPTREDALKAVKLYRDLLAEFPLVDGQSWSTALSGIITPIVRAAFPVAPIHIARASIPGSGKSYLWDTASAVAIGEIMPIISAGADVVEMEKRLGAGLMTGQSLISIDNVNGELGGSALCQYIERPRVQPVRILGLSKNVDVDLCGTTFYSTGNNISVSFEMVDRKIIADLDANMEKPRNRKFNNNPVATVLADRGEYIAAALTICRAYIIAGSPFQVNPLGSFEGWSNVVRSALMWLGESDPVNTTEEANDSDSHSDLNEVLIAWVKVIGVGPANHIKMAKLLELINKVTGYGATLEHRWPELATTVQAAVPHPDPSTLGHWLRDNKGVIVNDLKLMNKSDSKNGSRWWVQRKDDSHSEAGEMNYRDDDAKDWLNENVPAGADADGDSFGKTS
jgi:hypothetical protein